MYVKYESFSSNQSTVVSKAQNNVVDRDRRTEGRTGQKIPRITGTCFGNKVLNHGLKIDF